MNESILLNNDAVAHLQKGNTFEACDCLTRASKICLATVEKRALRRHRIARRDHIIRWVRFASTANKTSSDSDDNIACLPPPSLYQYAAVVQTTCCRQGSKESKEWCPKCQNDENICPSSIILVVWYNLALCCQLLGTEFGSQSSDGSFYYMRSAYLYNKILHIRAKASHSQALATLLLATLNNQACLHYDMGRFSDFSSLMRRLKQNLGVVSRPAGRRTTRRNWFVFHKNVVMMDYKRRRPAAAAA